jgi:very-short-patch-repair endonuclease
MGFLKWTPDDGTATRSPLLLVPVEIDAVQDSALLRTVYTLRLADREPCENPALREYLKLKYELQLPAFPQGTDPLGSEVSAWLRDKVTPITSTNPGWEIVDGLAFGLFDCGAIAADCEPSNWTLPLHKRKLLSEIFLSTDASHPAAAEPQFSSPSLLLEADGSQLEAIHRVASGSSIVLHGPPGSGKSQTIVNLIAQALAARKSVLFVAQKPEAAHVVQRRLAERGLAPFCTVLVPIGDSRNIKSAILEGLRRRHQLPRPNELPLQNQIARLEAHVATLDRYAGALRVVLPTLQRTARDVLAELALLSMRAIPRLERDEVVFPTCLSAFSSAEAALQQLAALYDEIPEDAFRRIGGLQPTIATTLAHDAAFALIQDLSAVRSKFQTLNTAVDRLAAMGYERATRRIEQLYELADTMPPTERLLDASHLTRALRLRNHGAQDALFRVLAARKSLGEVQRDIPHCRSLIGSEQIDGAAAARERLTWIHRFGVAGLRLGTAEYHARGVHSIRLALAEGASGIMAGPVSRLLAAADDFDQWRKIVALLEAVSKPHAGRTFLLQHAPSPIAPEQLAAIARSAEVVASTRSNAEAVAILDDLPNRTSLRVSQSAIAARASLASRVIGSLSDRRYRMAKRVAREVLLPSIRRADWAAALHSCILYEDAFAQWIATTERNGMMSSVSTESHRWDTANDWCRNITDLARLARVPMSVTWEIARGFEDQTHTTATVRLLEAASQLCSTEGLVEGVRKTLSGSATSLASISAALGRVVESEQDLIALGTALQLSADTSLEQIAMSGIRLTDLRDRIAAIADDVGARDLFQSDFQGIDSDTTPYVEAGAWLDLLGSPEHRPWRSLLDWVLADTARAAERGVAVHGLAQALDIELGAARAAIGRLQANFTVAAGTPGLQLDERGSLETAIERSESVLTHQPSIQRIFAFGIQCRHAESQAGSGVVRRFVRGEIPRAALLDSYRRTVFEEALRADPALAPVLEFERGAIESAVHELPKLDQSLRDSNAKLLVGQLMERRAPAGVSQGLVRDFTERGYVNHLIGLQRPRFEVQDLFRRANETLRSMQPCVIATPSAVSEYLPRDENLFDLLIMDEASQVPPSSAFGSIARARQAVIVGDPKQLPPTNFFMGATAADSDEDDEDSAGVTDGESILERAISALQNVHLKGHYRSRHHSLISFSNKRFYDRRLVVTPSVAPRNSRLGIVAHYLREARYSASTNELEAKEVAKHAMRHLRSGSSESLGIVAFNARQASLIETHLEQLAQQSQQSFDAYTRARQAKEPLFIRNLESVQGDERDVIFISYTYGPDSVSGQVYQRFGPVLRPGGERRLNVLVTRAKTRVEVFHSLLPNQITAESTGATAMREYLEYARQTPEFDFAVGDFESDFERQVADAIQALDSRILVRPQVSCDQFRIDLGISLRSNPDRFILGIECDGATYHSSLSARDRDLVRQVILEHHGWSIHRVWSTAWWTNPANELNRLEAAVRSAVERELARDAAADAP